MKGRPRPLPINHQSLFFIIGESMKISLRRTIAIEKGGEVLKGLRRVKRGLVDKMRKEGKVMTQGDFAIMAVGEEK